MTPQRGSRAAFTLIEMLAVLLLVSAILLFVSHSYANFARQSAEVLRRAESDRRAVFLLDLVASDLERAVLWRKRPEVDPIDHPWLFLAENRDGEPGADRLKFATRGRDSDFELVAWMAREGDDGDLELLRWSADELPERLDRDFPDRRGTGREDMETVAAGLADFGLRLQHEDGSWFEEWDSSTRVHSGRLPTAVEIRVALRAPAPRGVAARRDPDGSEDERTVGPFQRTILLPLRPYEPEDLEATPEGAGSAQTALQACLRRHPELADILRAHGFEPTLASSGNLADYTSQLPFLAVPEDCQ